MPTLADLHRSVQAILASKRLGTPVFVRYLLSEPAQKYFADQTFEYPLISGVPASVALQPLDELRTPDIDFARVADALPATLQKINASGLSRQ